jgi:hypothetical protein
MDQQHHIESLIAMAAAAYAAKYSQASIVKDLVVASKQNNVRGVQLNKFTNVWGISTSAVHTGCLGFPFGNYMISCFIQLKSSLQKLPRFARRPEGEKNGRGVWVDPTI